jgi:hypothetical protein
MAASRFAYVVTVAIVLGVAWYVGQEELGMGIAVAIVGLSAMYSRFLLAIPAAVVMAAATLYLSGVAVIVVLALSVVVLASISGDNREYGTWP